MAVDYCMGPVMGLEKEDRRLLPMPYKRLSIGWISRHWIELIWRRETRPLQDQPLAAEPCSVSHTPQTYKCVAVVVTMVCQAYIRQHYKEISELKA